MGGHFLGAYPRVVEERAYLHDSWFLFSLLSSLAFDASIDQCLDTDPEGAAVLAIAWADLLCM